MESSVMICAVLLWTAVFTAVSVEGTNLWTDPHTQLDSMVTAQDDTFFKDYHPLNEINAFFRKLKEKHKTLVKLVDSIAENSMKSDTRMKNQIFAVHITDDVDSTQEKRKIYIQCLVHAREWVTGAVCPYFAKYMVEKPKGNKQIQDQALLKKVEFVIVPVANPDGYERTWDTGSFIKSVLTYPWYGGGYRFWRKNMRVVKKTNKQCRGVDLNRNFPEEWRIEKEDEKIKQKKLSKRETKLLDLCDDTYRGPEPGSEPEVQHITKYIMSQKPMIGLMDFHCYYQAVLFPYGYTDKKTTKDHDYLFRVAYLTAHAMSKRHKQTYTAMDGQTFLYPSRGNIRDWAYSKEVATQNKDKFGKQYRIVPLGVELRPHYFSEVSRWTINSRHPAAFPSKLSDSKLRFLLPKDQILPTCEEATAGIIKFTELVSKEPLRFKGK